jgi:hypothetical protein
VRPFHRSCPHRSPTGPILSYEVDLVRAVDRSEPVSISRPLYPRQRPLSRHP